MTIYLDQNKWIQLARVINQKENNQQISEIPVLVKENIIDLPLSGIHYLETSRISNLGRRQRLGKVMWQLSKNRTIASSRAIIIHDLEIAMKQYFPCIEISELLVFSKGVRHAFGMEFETNWPNFLEEKFEEYLVTGELLPGEAPIRFDDVSHRQLFKTHLTKYKEIKKSVPKERYEDMIEATSLIDILEPIFHVLKKHGIALNLYYQLPKEVLSKILKSIPLLQIDMHLHRQLLKNENYFPKDSDLEDWSGLSIGAAYCDVLVCEKHFKDFITRDNFRTKAEIFSKLEDMVKYVKNCRSTTVSS